MLTGGNEIFFENVQKREMFFNTTTVSGRYSSTAHGETVISVNFVIC